MEPRAKRRRLSAHQIMEAPITLTSTSKNPRTAVPEAEAREACGVLRASSDAPGGGEDAHANTLDSTLSPPPSPASSESSVLSPSSTSSEDSPTASSPPSSPRQDAIPSLKTRLAAFMPLMAVANAALGNADASPGGFEILDVTEDEHDGEASERGAQREQSLAPLVVDLDDETGGPAIDDGGGKSGKSRKGDTQTYIEMDLGLGVLQALGGSDDEDASASNDDANLAPHVGQTEIVDDEQGARPSNSDQRAGAAQFDTVLDKLLDIGDKRREQRRRGHAQQPGIVEVS